MSISTYDSKQACQIHSTAVLLPCGHNASMHSNRVLFCLEGCITRLVRMSLTPQLMSKPTPPGDTTASGFPMSNAATFPIAKPYPECMSGSAIDFCNERTSDDRCLRLHAPHGTAALMTSTALAMQVATTP